MRPKKITPVDIRAGLYRRRYLVPNLITLSSMFCGFLAIIYSSSDRFEKAALAIGIAIVLDGLDGRLARRLNATSKFGVEFDSLSDLVSFGIAPAMLVYHWCFRVPADEFGVFACFVFALCAAARLARFNVAHENLSGFTGLPTPGAAGLIAALVNFAPRVASSLTHVVFGAFVVLSLAFLMVSQIEYHSVKKFRVRSMHLPLFVALGALIALLWYHGEVGFILLALGYVGSGPTLAFWGRRRATQTSTSADQEERYQEPKETVSDAG